MRREQPDPSGGTRLSWLAPLEEIGSPKGDGDPKILPASAWIGAGVTSATAGSGDVSENATVRQSLGTAGPQLPDIWIGGGRDAPISGAAAINQPVGLKG